GGRAVGGVAAGPAAVAEAAQQASDREQQQAGDDAALREVLRVARAVAWEFARQYGRGPDAEQFQAIEQFARFVTLNGADTRPVDPRLLLRGWGARCRAGAGETRRARGRQSVR